MLVSSIFIYLYISKYIKGNRKKVDIHFYIWTKFWKPKMAWFRNQVILITSNIFLNVIKAKKINFNFFFLPQKAQVFTLWFIVSMLLFVSSCDKRIYLDQIDVCSISIHRNIRVCLNDVALFTRRHSFSGSYIIIYYFWTNFNSNWNSL